MVCFSLQWEVFSFAGEVKRNWFQSMASQYQSLPRTLGELQLPPEALHQTLQNSAAASKHYFKMHLQQHRKAKQRKDQKQHSPLVLFQRQLCVLTTLLLPNWKKNKDACTGQPRKVSYSSIKSQTVIHLIIETLCIHTQILQMLLYLHYYFQWNSSDRSSPLSKSTGGNAGYLAWWTAGNSQE